jgi:GxxExxY protein
MQMDPKPGLVHGADVTDRIIGAAIRVHRGLGPGLLENVYERCLCHELEQAGVPFQRQTRLPVVYGDIEFDCAYIADLIVAEQVIVEIKAVEKLLPVHHAHLLTYLRMTACRVGLLLNFNTILLKDGIKRCVL